MTLSLALAFTEGRVGFEYRFWLAIFLILYFSSQHVENTLTLNDYSKSMFVSDLVETFLMFAIFLFLGIFNFPYSVCSDFDLAWVAVYAPLIMSFLMPPIARVATKSFGEAMKDRKTWLSLVAVALACIGLIAPENYVIVVGLSGIFAFYLWKHVFVRAW